MRLEGGALVADVAARAPQTSPRPSRVRSMARTKRAGWRAAMLVMRRRRKSAFEIGGAHREDVAAPERA